MKEREVCVGWGRRWWMVGRIWLQDPKQQRSSPQSPRLNRVSSPELWCVFVTCVQLGVGRAPGQRGGVGLGDRVGRTPLLGANSFLSRMTTTFCLLLPTSPIYIFTKYCHLYLPNVPKYEAELRKPRPTKIMGSPLQWEVRGESRCPSPAVLHPLPPWVLLRRGLMGLGPAPDGTLEGAGEPGSFWA